MDNLVPDDHDPNEDASYAEFRFTFYGDMSNLDDEGNPAHMSSATEAHLHNVPSLPLVDALLLSARRLVADQMAESMFNESIPEEVRRQASENLSIQWLVHRLHSQDLTSTETVDFNVPDDASELLE